MNKQLTKPRRKSYKCFKHLDLEDRLDKIGTSIEYLDFSDFKEGDKVSFRFDSMEVEKVEVINVTNERGRHMTGVYIPAEDYNWNIWNKLENSEVAEGSWKNLKIILYSNE